MNDKLKGYGIRIGFPPPPNDCTEAGLYVNRNNLIETMMPKRG